MALEAAPEAQAHGSTGSASPFRGYCADQDIHLQSVTNDQHEMCHCNHDVEVNGFDVQTGSQVGSVNTPGRKHLADHASYRHAFGGRPFTASAIQQNLKIPDGQPWIACHFASIQCQVIDIDTLVMASIFIAILRQHSVHGNLCH